MYHNEAIAVVDIGSTKVTVAVGEKGLDGKVRVAGISSIPAEGFFSGAVQSPSHAEKTLEKLLTDIQLKTGRTVKTVSVAISSTDISGINSEGTVCISGKNRTVTTSDLACAEKVASTVNIPAGKEVYQRLSQGFVIDDEPVGDDPLGRHGVKLTDQMHLIFGPAIAGQQIINAINGCNCRVEDLLSSSLAAAEGSLTKDEKEMGTLFIDMGGDFTGFHIFHNGVPVFSGTVPYAGNIITEDISRVLVAPFEEAERLKMEYGVCRREDPSFDFNKTILSVSGYEGYNTKRVEMSILDAIIECRVEEILESIQNIIKEKRFLPFINGGIVISGGGALLAGLDTYVASFFDKPARIGFPRDCNTIEMQYRTPAFSAIVGMLHHYGQKERDSGALENHSFDKNSSNNSNSNGDYNLAENNIKKTGMEAEKKKDRISRLFDAFF